MRAPGTHLGMIATPAQGNRLDAAYTWCADNGAFSGRYPGDAAYLRWLAARAEHAARCVFVAAPDVPGDAAATLARSAPMLDRIREAGYPVALVAQPGAEHQALPWGDLDAVFLGGDTAWKLGPGARRLVEDARSRGVHVHMGRVNSMRRVRYAHSIGVHSVDGTYMTFAPNAHLPHVLKWLRTVHAQDVLN